MIEPEVKAKALLGQNMYKQWLNGKRIEDIYGNIDILRDFIRINNCEITTKQIYDILIKDTIEKNRSIIESRNKKERLVSNGDMYGRT